MFAAVIVIDVFLKSFIIVSTYRRRHVLSEMGFKQNSPNLNRDSDSLIECTLSLHIWIHHESEYGFDNRILP